MITNIAFGLYFISNTISRTLFYTRWHYSNLAHYAAPFRWFRSAARAPFISLSRQNFTCRYKYAIRSHAPQLTTITKNYEQNDAAILFQRHEKDALRIFDGWVTGSF